jgi:hypothetical protein
MKPDGRIRIFVLLGFAVVVVHCVAVLAAALRLGQLMSAHLRSAGVGHLVGVLAGAALAAAVAWLLLAALGVGGLALWLRIQRVRP